MLTLGAPSAVGARKGCRGSDLLDSQRGFSIVNRYIYIYVYVYVYIFIYGQ